MIEGLGPLPAPQRAGDLKPETHVYTADALWFYAAAERLAERERCAQLCEREARMHSHGDVTGRGAGADRADVARTCAAVIRKPANA